MLEEKFLSVLKECELFNCIKKSEIRLLLDCLNPRCRSFERNEFVVRIGDKLESLGIILEGEASIFKESVSGNRMLIKNIKAGEMFGEIAAFARKEEWPALVQAITPVSVCFIPKDRIVGQCVNLCKWHAALINNMLGIVSERAMLLSQKMHFISIKTMRSKLCTYIFEQYSNQKALTIKLPMNRIQLADFLNVSRSSMTRELSRMRDEGIIDFHLSTLKIKDLERLKYFCE